MFLCKQTNKIKNAQGLEENRRRVKENIDQVKNILTIQDIVGRLFVDDSALEAVKYGVADKLKPIKEERIQGLRLLHEVAFPDRKKPEPFEKQLDVAAEKLWALSTNKKKGQCVKGSSFTDIRETVFSIHKSGLFGETGASSPVSQLSQQPQQVNGVLQEVPSQMPIQTEQQPPQQQVVHQQIVHPQPIHPQVAQYSFGTVGGVEGARPDHDPAVVAYQTNGTIPTQIFNSSSFHGVYVPVTQIPPGAQMIHPQTGQFVPASPQHYQQQHLHSNDQEHPEANNNQESFDDQAGDQLNNNLENLKISDGQQVQTHGDNEFRVKDHRRNKFNNQGQKKDFERNPAHQYDRHGSSSGFQRKGDRYQGNQRRK
jgi:hypothetical protein